MAPCWVWGFWAWGVLLRCQSVCVHQCHSAVQSSAVQARQMLGACCSLICSGPGTSWHHRLHPRCAVHGHICSAPPAAHLLQQRRAAAVPRHALQPEQARAEPLRQVCPQLLAQLPQRPRVRGLLRDGPHQVCAQAHEEVDAMVALGDGQEQLRGRMAGSVVSVCMSS